MIRPRPVSAEWVPLRGPDARKPTAISWRQRSKGAELFDLVILSEFGMDILHTPYPDTGFNQYENMSEVTHWLEGHPEVIPDG